MERYTNKKAGKLCNKVLNAARGIKNPHPGMVNAWQDDKGRTYVCDGFRAYRLDNMPEGLTEQWTSHISAARVNDAQRAHAAIERMFDTIDNGYYVVPMPAPDTDSVISASRCSIYDDGIKYDMGEDYPTINAKYLRDIVELLPGAEWYCTDSDKRMTSPVYAVSVDGIAIVLPIRTEVKHHWRKSA